VPEGRGSQTRKGVVGSDSEGKVPIYINEGSGRFRGGGEGGGALSYKKKEEGGEKRGKSADHRGRKARNASKKEGECKFLEKKGRGVATVREGGILPEKKEGGSSSILEEKGGVRYFQFSWGRKKGKI